MVSITDKQAGRLWELLLEGALAQTSDPHPQRLQKLKKEFVEILTWGCAAEASKK